MTQTFPPSIEVGVNLLKIPEGKALFGSLEKIASELGTTLTKERADDGFLVRLNRIEHCGHIAVIPYTKNGGDLREECLREECAYSALTIRAYSYPDGRSVHAFNDMELQITRAIAYIRDRLQQIYWDSSVLDKSL